MGRSRGEAEEREGRESERERGLERERGVGPCSSFRKVWGFGLVLFLA